MEPGVNLNLEKERKVGNNVKVLKDITTLRARWN